jgi:1-acyl-sn-glycerol-3-phosphate acyltransferase
MKKDKVIYYHDELNDDFEGKNITPIKIDGNYKYIHKNLLWNLSAAILYRGILTPACWLYGKIKFGLKIENKEILKLCKNSGYFIYINHTQDLLDVMTPTFVGFPKRAFVIAHPSNVSMRGLKTIIRMLGALPIPGDMASSRNFMNAIQQKINNKNVIAIYPEAHVWPYYTKVRPFKSTSFGYPVEFDAPVFSVTITYQKRKYRKEPKIVEYIDGPFFPDNSLSKKNAKEKLRNEIYNKMVERSNNSNIEVIKYIKETE